MLREISISVVTLVVAMIIFSYLTSTDLQQLKNDVSFRVKKISADLETSDDDLKGGSGVQVIRQAGFDDEPEKIKRGPRVIRDDLDCTDFRLFASLGSVDSEAMFTSSCVRICREASLKYSGYSCDEGDYLTCKCA